MEKGQTEHIKLSRDEVERVSQAMWQAAYAQRKNLKPPEYHCKGPRRSAVWKALDPFHAGLVHFAHTGEVPEEVSLMSKSS